MAEASGGDGHRGVLWSPPERRGDPVTVQWTTFAVALLAAVASVVAAVLGARGQRRTALATADRAVADRAQELLDRYQEPLLRAAYDLQSRLYNILKRGLFETPELDRRYVERSTVWLLGQYLGWAEIIRREAQFLKPAAAEDRATVQRLLGDVARALSSDSLGDPRLQVQRSEQRALGEVMMTRGRDADGDERSDCLGYAAFDEAMDNSDSRAHRWFTHLLPQVWPEHDRVSRRLLPLQHALIALIDHMDPQKIRFPERRLRA